MKQVKNQKSLESVKKQLVQFNSKAVVGGDTRLSTGKKIVI